MGNIRRLKVDVIQEGHVPWVDRRERYRKILVYYYVYRCCSCFCCVFCWWYNSGIHKCDLDSYYYSSSGKMKTMPEIPLISSSGLSYCVAVVVCDYDDECNEHVFNYVFIRPLFFSLPLSVYIYIVLSCVLQIQLHDKVWHKSIKYEVLNNCQSSRAFFKCSSILLSFCFLDLFQSNNTWTHTQHVCVLIINKYMDKEFSLVKVERVLKGYFSFKWF